MSEEEFIALLKEKIYETADDKKKRAKKAEVNRDALLEYAAAAIKAGSTGGLPALKALWERQFTNPSGEQNQGFTGEENTGAAN